MQGQWIPAAILAVAATPLSAQTAAPVKQAEALPDLAVPADRLGDDRKYHLPQAGRDGGAGARGPVVLLAVPAAWRGALGAGLRAVAQGRCQPAGEL